jgi:hypothetical protein
MTSPDSYWDLVGQQYFWVCSAFYFGYLVASYPASLCFVKLPLGKFWPVPCMSKTFINLDSQALMFL